MTERAFHSARKEGRKEEAGDLGLGGERAFKLCGRCKCIDRPTESEGREGGREGKSFYLVGLCKLLITGRHSRKSRAADTHTHTRAHVGAFLERGNR